MRNTNPQGELIELIGDIASKRSADESIGEWDVGQLKADGSIDIGESTISKEDYKFLTHTVVINGKTVVIPSIKDQTVEITHTHPSTGGTEKITIKFPKVPVGADLLMMQLEDGDYIVFGEV